MIDTARTYVAGKWLRGDRTFSVENPADASVVAEVSVTPRSEVARAVVEARRAFDAGVWARVTGAERERTMYAFLDFVESRFDDLIQVLVAEAGHTVTYADFQVRQSLSLARGAIDLYMSLPEEEPNPVPTDDLLARTRTTLSLRRFEPIGVVSAITPFNAAVIMGLQKLAPALMAGNSVVLRPSPLTPISSLVFAEAAEAVGLPDGVLSVVIENGTAGAELMTSDPDVDMVSFTGSTAVGRTILEQAAPSIKRVSLELGGKSAQIYLEDALDHVGNGAAAVVAMTAGQVCVAATRMLVPQHRKDEVLERAAEAMSALSIGDPLDPATMVGPLINAAQRERCEHFVSSAEQHGGEVVVGGRRPPHLDRGYYFEPTLIDLPDNANPAAREEIFGPVLGVIGYQDLDDAIHIANDTSYGLSGQVYGLDVAAATAVARRLRTGAVNVNTGLLSAYAPGGGYKRSGLGRERGIEGIREFQEVKHLAIGDLR